MVAAVNIRLRQDADAILFFNLITSTVSIGGVPRSVDRAAVAKDHPVREGSVGRSATPDTRFRLRPPPTGSRSEGPID
jgi:hypothetical protein